MGKRTSPRRAKLETCRRLGCILTCACSCEQEKRQRAVGSCERPRRSLDRFGGRVEVGASSPREGGRVQEKEVHRKSLKEFAGTERVFLGSEKGRRRVEERPSKRSRRSRLKELDRAWGRRREVRAGEIQFAAGGALESAECRCKRRSCRSATEVELGIRR